MTDTPLTQRISNPLISHACISPAKEHGGDEPTPLLTEGQCHPLRWSGRLSHAGRGKTRRSRRAPNSPLYISFPNWAESEKLAGLKILGG